ncbi:MAG: hypothetical protein A3F16_00950 [Deltaproteobacteria bacterium RIFCSPHIGHO2_12_FULL_43_9]|nr:MAG: hypothetical protein A3F16_00950 [Deltaproteobacteria bacterium RIFCSPHIGHO2_12_FULL_43_9]
MTALDTNILIAVLVSSSPKNQDAQRGLQNLNDLLCTTPTNVGEVLRLLTHPKVFEKPLKLSKAVSLFSSFMESYGVLILDESTDWWINLVDIEKEIQGLKGNEIFDARIALCLQSHGVKRIFTWDSDFRKYPFLKILQP